MNTEKIDYYEFSSRSNIGHIMKYLTNELNPNPNIPDSKYIILCDLDGVILTENTDKNTEITIRNKMDDTLAFLEESISNKNCEGFYIFTLRGDDDWAMSDIVDHLRSVNLFDMLCDKYKNSSTQLKIPKIAGVRHQDFIISMRNVPKIDIINLILKYNEGLVIDYFFFIDNSLVNLVLCLICFKSVKLVFKRVGLKLGHFLNPNEVSKMATRIYDIPRVMSIKKQVTSDNECT